MDALAKDHFRGQIAAAHAAHIALTRDWALITDEDRAPMFQAAGVYLELLPERSLCRVVDEENAMAARDSASDRLTQATALSQIMPQPRDGSNVGAVLSIYMDIVA